MISRFLNEGLIDEMHLFIVPVLLGEGIPLFTGLQSDVSLHLVQASPYRTGIVKLLYVPKSRGPEDQKT